MQQSMPDQTSSLQLRISELNNLLDIYDQQRREYEAELNKAIELINTVIKELKGE